MLAEFPKELQFKRVMTEVIQQVCAPSAQTSQKVIDVAADGTVPASSASERLDSGAIQPRDYMYSGHKDQYSINITEPDLSESQHKSQKFGSRAQLHPADHTGQGVRCSNNYSLTNFSSWDRQQNENMSKRFNMPLERISENDIS